MEERGQFTFYRSFWDAVRGLPKKDRLPILEAIISYALDGGEPEGLQQSQMAFFLLCRPTLDASRKKAVMGRNGGSKPKAKRGKNESEKENEKENENEVEIENKYECKRAREFARFWEAYPRKVGKQKAREVYLRAEADPEVILSALTRQKGSSQWQRDNGQYIPYPATWLSGRRWEDEAAAGPPVRVPDAQERAAVRRLMELE